MIFFFKPFTLFEMIISCSLFMSCALGFCLSFHINIWITAFYGVLTSLKFVFSLLQIFPGCFLKISFSVKVFFRFVSFSLATSCNLVSIFLL